MWGCVHCCSGVGIQQSTATILRQAALAVLMEVRLSILFTFVKLLVDCLFGNKG